MKIRWQFHFEYEDLEFERTYNYEATISKEQAEKFGLPTQEFKAFITIKPIEKKDASIRQLGILEITLPGDVEQTEKLAGGLAIAVAQQISFSQGKMKIDGSLISAERLPETEAEIEQIGKKPFFFKVHLVEVLPPTPFKSSSLQKVVSNPLIIQFNVADKNKNPIDSFIGLFKILEDLYGSPKRKDHIADSLKKSVELKQIAMNEMIFRENNVKKYLTEMEFESLIDDFVRIRHECAHLRSSTGFGISYGDSRVQTDVKPLLEPLRIIAFEAVQKHISKI